MWYGIIINGTLTKVVFFPRPPNIWDFDLSYVSSSNKYEIVEVDVITKNSLHNIF